jgi:hypothetical protein
MKSRKTRRSRKTTRKRGGATIPDYTQALEARKQMLREMISLMETELNGKRYITKSLENQLLDAIETYNARFLQHRVPSEIRRADTEYMQLFRRYEELAKRLMDIQVRG